METSVHDSDLSLATQPRMFLLIRSIAFGFIMFLCFLWTILLSVVLFAQWDVMNHTERSLMFIILAVDSFTVIMLPILLLRQFRPWLDAARFCLLIILHAGVAGLFTYKSHEFQCSSGQSVDQGAVCNLIVLYVIISSWFVAACIIGYACGLAVLYRRLSRVPSTSELEAYPESKPRPCRLTCVSRIKTQDIWSPDIVLASSGDSVLL